MASLPWPGYKERDRQRERQRQERKEMLPNDDKDVTHSPPDLFHPPRQVKSEDQTSLEIKKSLGNFDSVRPFMLDNSSRRLIGVDQPTAGSAASSGGTTVDPKSRQPATTGAAGVAGTGGRYNPSPNKAPSHRNYPQGPGSSGTSSGSSSATSHIFRTAPNPIPHKPPNQPQPLLSITPNFNPGSNLPQGHGANNSFSTSNSTSTHVNPLRNSNPATNYLHSNNSGTSSVEATVPLGEITPKVDKINSSSASHPTEKFTLRSTAPNVGVPNDKDKSTVSVTNNKPTLERVDSQEVESMLREMMDVKAPLSAIQTPLKESSPKKLQRRSSKEESVIQNAANNSNSSPKSSKMDSSGDSSDDSSSESTSEEDSSSGSQAGGENNDSISLKNPPATNSPTRNWDLSTIMGNLKKNEVIKPADSSVAAKSPKQDMKQRKNLHGGNVDDICLDTPAKAESGVTSTSVSGKLRSSSPLENLSLGLSHLAKVPGKSPRRTPDARPDPSPAKLPPTNTTSSKAATSSSIRPKAQSASLSASSSDEEEVLKPTKDLPPRNIPKSSAPPAVVNSSRGKKRPPERDIPKSEDDSSPETKAKHRKGVQDKNKNKMIGNLFRGRHKKDKAESPVLTAKVSPSSGANVIGGTSSNVASSKQNRVSAKDNGKKSASSTSVPTATSTPTSLVQNGELESNSKPGTLSTNTKKKQGGKASSVKDTKATPPATTHHRGGKRQKPNTPVSTKTTGGTTLTPPASSVVRIKEDPPTTIKSLMCKIPLSKIPGKLFPLLPPATTPLKSAPRNSSSKQASPAKAEKVSKNSRPPAHTLPRDESTRVKLHYDSSRVGSSSDQTNDTHVQPPRTGPLGENSLCSDLSRVSTNSRSSYKRERRKSKSSPKKSKVSAEPIPHSKMDDDSIATCEVSSNVIGYSSSFEPAPVSTSRTPPVEMETLQAPDSSLNPPHLPSPVVQPQLQYYSYFEKSEHNDNDDYYTRGHEVYVEEAKRLKHKADREESGHQTQASTYLEAGLYFILAGNSMDRGGHVSREAYTMYKDTLQLIRYITTRFRNSRQDNIYETKVTILSLRCQSLLVLRLAKMKMKDIMDAGQYLNEQFRKAPPMDMPPMTNSLPPIANSPQLSTPSPHSPTLSPAGSSGILLGLTPSPHHPQQNHQASHTITVSRTLYNQMYKHVTNTTNLINAHEWWDGADHLIEKHNLQDFFISIDRIYGPLTLHTTLMDLVRYVRHGLGVLKSCSDLS